MPNVTLGEISRQPDLWLEIYERVKELGPDLQPFVSEARQQQDLEVLFTGAGSSAFVGEAVAGLFQAQTGAMVRAVATTDLVTHLRLFVRPSRPLLLVSFSRSGDSPESRAAVEMVDAIHPRARHLIITCNRDGALARLAGRPRTKVLLLPEAANDQGLAMIGSVTGMILAALLVARLDQLPGLRVEVETASRYGRTLLDCYSDSIRERAATGFERAICLGSGPLLGIAREAHLKILELSAGKVECRFDSFLGFRHGPRVAVNDKTLVFYFLSNDPYVAQYERDLVLSVQRSQRPLCSIAVSESDASLPVDLALSLGREGDRLEEGFLTLPYLLAPQLLAVHKSLSLGLDPDSPSESGVIHRVVQGVTIYPCPT